MARHCPKPKRIRDATWFRDKVLLVEAQGSGKVLNEEELEFLTDLGVTKGPVTQTVITHNAAYQADDLAAYDFNCDEFSTAKAVLMANLSSYGSDFLSEVPQDYNVSSATPCLSIHDIYVMYCPYIRSLSVMLSRISFHVLYDRKAQQIKTMLYDGSVIAKETNVISIADSKETLMLEEESRSKMLLKQSDPMVLEKKVNIKPINYAKLSRLSKDFGKHFVPQQELSDEQAFRLQTSHANTDQSASSPVKIKAPRKLPKTYKQLYDSIKRSRVHSKERAESLVNQLNQKKFKGKDIVDNSAQVSNATTISPRMYKLDPVTLALKDKNNKETHIYYLKHTMEQVAILREIVKQAKSLNPLDSASYSACKYVKLIQEF
nr:hypothetical protein [Tanacetum cinerariifolium]